MQKTKFLISIAIVSGFMIGTQACGQRTPQTTQSHSENHMEMAETNESINKAICVLQPTEGNTTSGTILFFRTDEGIRVVGEVKGLTPGKHGFHVHEFGDCSSPDGTAAGGHFNPSGHEHGDIHATERHVGDLGNIEAGNDGIARIEIVDTLLAFEGPNSIIGRTIIVHADPDDLHSQPTGNAGARVAQGVIGIAQ